MSVTMVGGERFELYLGDAMHALPLLESGRFKALITDPPYGIDFQSQRKEKGERLSKILNDKQPFVWFLWDAARLLKDDGHLICFCRWDVQEAFRQAIEWAGLRVKQQVIWDRDWHGMGDLNGTFAPQHDVIWHAVKSKSSQVYGVRPKSVIRIPRLHSEITHPNEKPVELMRYLVRAVTQAGDHILDPFAGSGSTMKAAIIEGRSVTGIELDYEKYHAILKEFSLSQQQTMELQD